MESPTLLLGAFMTAIAALAYAYVGHRLGARESADLPTARALTAFATWWWTMAGIYGLASMLYAAGGLGYTSFELQLTYILVQRLLLVVGLAGLMYYLTHLFTGKARVLPLAAGYGGVYVYLLALLFAGEPTDVFVGRWRMDLLYTHPTSPVHALVNLVVLVLPPLAGALLYFRLMFAVDDGAQRYRIALVGSAIAAWSLVAILAGQRQMLDNDMVQLANRAVGLAAALAVLLAYEPPSWIRRRWSTQRRADAMR